MRGQLKNFLYGIALAAGTLPGPASSHGDPAVAAIAGHAINRGPDSMASSADAPAARAITLAPHITELIFAAGAGDRIIATVSSSDYPDAALSIPRVGDGMNINVEKIVALKPDLVAAWLPSGAAQTLAPALSRLHVPLIYSQPESLDDIPSEIRKFGRLFGTQAVAEPIAASLEQRIQTLAARYADRPQVSVFIEVGTAPLYTIGRDPLLNNVLRICGGMNIYGLSSIAAPQVSVESLLVKQPDAVITTVKTDRLEQRRQEWLDLHLTAAVKQHVYALDPDTLFRPGPRLVDAAEQLCANLEQVRQTNSP